MMIPFEAAWDKLVCERIDSRFGPGVFTKADIESVTGNEFRLMAKMDSSVDVPAVLRRHGYFILPIKNGEYILCVATDFTFWKNCPNHRLFFAHSLISI